MTEDLYIGRIVAVAKTPAGALTALYRVSSRSFPNRTAVVSEDRVSIVPKAGHETDIQRNPYIAYNCARIVADRKVAVLTNGSQTDPIAEKIDQGMPVRDALILSHMALDYEKDDYNTPRVSSVIDSRDDSAWLATVREDGLDVRRMPVVPSKLFYVATYEENTISPHQSDAFSANDAAAAGAYILNEGVFAHRRNPITAVTAVATSNGFELHAQDAPSE